MLVKICGITRQRDLDQIASLGVNLCGFIFHPQSPRYIQPAKAASFNCGGVKKTGVFVNQTLDEIKDACDLVGLDYIQLHGGQSPEFASQLPREKVIKVFWPDKYATPNDLMIDLSRFAQCSAFYLLDSGAGSGGSGRSFDWSKIGALNFPVPWLLAGGLNKHNIGKALSALSPAGIDVNSGVEDAPGIKNIQKIVAFLKIANAGQAQTRSDT